MTTETVRQIRLSKDEREFNHRHLSRAVYLDVCKDGTISYRAHKGRRLNDAALPVFSVDNIAQAQDFQVAFCRKQYVSHPDQPDRPWFRLSRLGDGTDPACRTLGPGAHGHLELDDMPGITQMFQQFWDENFTPHMLRCECCFCRPYLTGAVTL